MHQAYFTVADTYKDWALRESPDFQPNARQACVIEAVQSALDAGLHYTRDVHAHCVSYLAISDDVLAVGAKRVEGGDFGMDCYYARGVIDARAKRVAELAASATFHVGQKVPRFIAGISDTYTSGVITELSGTTCKLTAKRGGRVVELKWTPLGLKRSIERVAERAEWKRNPPGTVKDGVRTVRVDLLTGAVS